jgi:hypothetical protein
VNAPKGAQVGAECRAGPFAGVAVDLASAITVIVSGPLAHAMAHAAVGGMAAVIALPFVGVEYRPSSRDSLRDQCVTGPFTGVIANPETVYSAPC